MAMDVRLNAKERGESKQRVFACRLTDGRIAVVQSQEESEIQFYSTIADAKQAVAILVPDSKLPLFSDYELSEVRHTLSMAQAKAAV